MQPSSGRRWWKVTPMRRCAKRQLRPRSNAPASRLPAAANASVPPGSPSAARTAAIPPPLVRCTANAATTPAAMAPVSGKKGAAQPTRGQAVCRQPTRCAVPPVAPNAVRPRRSAAGSMGVVKPSVTVARSIPTSAVHHVRSARAAPMATISAVRPTRPVAAVAPTATIAPILARAAAVMRAIAR